MSSGFHDWRHLFGEKRVDCYTGAASGRAVGVLVVPFFFLLMIRVSKADAKARGRNLAAPVPARLPRPDSSVVERGPEKAGVGGSIPSLATNI